MMEPNAKGTAQEWPEDAQRLSVEGVVQTVGGTTRIFVDNIWNYFTQYINKKKLLSCSVVSYTALYKN